MIEKIKADLHMHPHFSQPKDDKRATSISKIVNTLFEKNLTIASLSAMHPQPNALDYRFYDYLAKLPELIDEFEYSYNSGKYFSIRKIKQISGQPESIYILNSQEIRTNYKEMPADINIIGVNRIIMSGQSIDETAKIGREEGGIVLLCHANSKCGAGIEKAIEMYDDGKIHGVEIDATSTIKENQELINRLKTEKIKGFPVSDSHYISDAGASYALFLEEVLYNFSIQSLAQEIKTENFEQHIGQVSEFSKFLHHTLPIALSVPKHLVKNPLYIIKALSNRKA